MCWRRHCRCRHGVDTEGVGDDPPTMAFGGGDAGVVAEDVGEASHAEELGEGNADIDADALCRRPEKS